MKKLLLSLVVLMCTAITPVPIMKPLAWEQPGKPARQKWSEHTIQYVYRKFDKLDKAIDISYFCPNYHNMNRDERVNAWAQLVASIAWFESGWNPRARMPDPRLGFDPVTGDTVIAEGLLQLGYSDSMWREYCRFDWYGDRALNDDDLNRTMINPRTHLECGVGILASQVERHGRIVIDSGAYWAVIKLNHRNQKIDGIRRMVMRLPMCLDES